MTKKLTQFPLLMLVVCTIWLQALHVQAAEYVPNELLVQIEEGADMDRIVKEIGQTFPDLQLDRELCRHMHIWQVSFDHRQTEMSRIYRALYAHPSVKIIQKNHLIQHRATTPDDTQFSGQWQYINSGGFGSVADADLDAEEAWDYATGGMTALGDEIVVCVVDDGVDDDHEDWGDNLWKNEAEIPNNGVDDDGNGYTDDYNGWNADNNTDNVSGGFAGGHGTPVAGIVGAQGNNGRGVTGVSWDVKVMIVQGGGNEAQAIAAYSYALTMRKKYNETNGAEGAFVVATNSSWGINGGQPEDSPLWCEYYDTMGLEGILSAGATINGNQNVDTFGDLPTACSSEYLISVTNLNQQDNKVNQAGYGLTTIDLGAYGENTYTLTSGNGYGGFGGTSGATPHVAGTIGLLYSAECPGLINLAYADPAAAAAMVRDAILEGVVPLDDLDGITVTGGKLNMHNAMLNVLDLDCGGCFAANDFTTEAATLESATITWSTNGETESFNIRYRLNGDSEWTEDTTTDLNWSIANLEACTEYEFQVQSLCTDENSDYSDSYIFVTDGCCDAPQASDSSTGDNSATVELEGVTIATSYTAEIAVAGTQDWQTASVDGTTVFATGLEPCTEYVISLGSACGGDSNEEDNLISVFTTGCSLCQLDYCPASAQDNSFEHIQSVSIGDYTNTSTEDNNAFGDYVGDPIEIILGENYDLELSAGYSGTEYSETWQIFVDLNYNQEFEANEEVYSSSPTAGTVTGSFSLSEDETPGTTRLRVLMFDSSYSDPADGCGEISYGEIEEYCVSLIGACDISADFLELEPQCAGSNNGVIDIEIEGDPADYTFTWTGSDATGPIASNLEAGDYSVMIDNGDCVQTYDFELDEPSALEVSTNSEAATDGANGTALVNVDGGSGNYNYVWADFPEQNTASIGGLVAGSYNVVVTDGNGCVIDTTVEVECGIAIDGNISPPSCDGSADASIMVDVLSSGGAGNLVFDWGGGQTDAMIEGLSAGEYSVVVSDGPCLAFADYEIENPEPISFDADVSNSDDNNNGAIFFEATGGTGSYVYFVNGESSSSEGIQNLAPGAYEINVVDSNGCESTTELVEIGCLLEADFTATDLNCAGDESGDIQIDVLYSGGSGDYTYSWENSDNTDNGLEGIAAGTYDVTVSDGSNCSNELTIIVDEPEALLVDSSFSPSTDGTDGSINLDVSGGTGTYSYDWQDLGAEGDSASGLGAGTYTVIVSDQNGCSTEIDVTVEGANVGTEQAEHLVLDIYPNPVQSQVQVNTAIQVDQISVQNILGQVLFSIENPSMQILIDTKALPAGMYLLQIRKDNEVYSEKLVKNH